MMDIKKIALLISLACALLLAVLLVDYKSQENGSPFIDLILVSFLGISTFAIYLKALRGKSIQVSKQQVLPFFYMTLGIMIVMIAYALYVLS